MTNNYSNAAVFDLDGTLCNTLFDLADATNAALKAYGLPERSLHEIQYTIGSGAKNQILKSMPEEKQNDTELFQKVHALYIETYAKNYLVKTKPYNDMPEAISLLKNKGIKLGVVTNKPHPRAIQIVESGFPGLFDFIAGANGEFPLKPDPTLTLHCISSLGSCPENTVYVGDSDVDVKTSINAKAKGMFVTWGFRTQEEMSLVGAKDFSDTPMELAQKILNYFERG